MDGFKKKHLTQLQATKEKFRHEKKYGNGGIISKLKIRWYILSLERIRANQFIRGKE